MQGITVRPLAGDWRLDAVIEVEMTVRRAAYRDLAPASQMMAATILWLHRDVEEQTWLVDVPYTWHAADGVTALKKGNARAEWGGSSRFTRAGSGHGEDQPVRFAQGGGGGDLLPRGAI